MKKILVISFMLFSANFCFAQSSRIDSLKNDLNSYTKKDTTRVNKLMRYALSLYKNKQPDESFLYVRQAIEL